MKIRRFFLLLVIMSVIFINTPRTAKADIPSIDELEIAMNTCFSDNLSDDTESLHTIVDIQEAYSADGKKLLFVYVPGNYITTDSNDTIEKALDTIHEKCGTCYNESYQTMITYLTDDMTTGGQNKIVIEKFKLKNSEAAKKYSELVSVEGQKDYSEYGVMGKGIYSEFINYLKPLIGTPIEKYDYSKDIPADVESIPSPVYNDEEIYAAVAKSLKTAPASDAAIDSELTISGCGKNVKVKDITAKYVSDSDNTVIVNLTDTNEFRGRSLCHNGKYKLTSVTPQSLVKAFPNELDIKGSVNIPVALNTQELTRQNLLLLTVLFMVMAAIIGIIIYRQIAKKKQKM